MPSSSSSSASAAAAAAASAGANGAGREGEGERESGRASRISVNLMQPFYDRLTEALAAEGVTAEGGPLPPRQRWSAPVLRRVVGVMIRTSPRHVSAWDAE